MAEHAASASEMAGAVEKDFLHSESDSRRTDATHSQDAEPATDSQRTNVRGTNGKKKNRRFRALKKYVNLYI